MPPGDDRTTRLLAVGTLLARARTAEEVVDVVLREGRETFAADAGGVVVVDGPVLRLLRAVGYEAEVSRRYDGMPLDAVSPLTDIVRTGHPQRTTSAQELAERYPDLPHSALSHSFVGMPLQGEHGVVGVLALSSLREDAFPEDEREVLQALAGLCGLALERCRLQAAQELGMARLAFLADAGQRLSASLDVPATLATVADLAVPQVAEWCSVHLLEDGEPRLVEVRHADPVREALLRDLFDRYPPDAGRGSGIGQALGELRVVVHSRFPESTLRAIARDDGHLDALRRLRLGSAVLVPLIVGGRPLGVVTLVRGQPDAYSDEDVALATELGARMASAVDNALRYRAQREAAVTLQESLLPRHFPEVPGLALGSRYLPGTAGIEVGGDWFDVVPLPGGRVGLVIGDVMGRGLAAAAVMGQLRASLRAYALVEPAPGQVLARLDAAVAALEQTALTTCLYAVLEPATGRLTLASAGHLPPVLSRADGTVTELPVDAGPPLGVLTGPPAESSLTLDVGDTLLLFTDGLVEDRTRSLDAGMAALREAVRAAGTGPLDRFCGGVVDRLSAGRGADDDLALLVVRRVPVAGDDDEVRVRLAGHHAEVARARRVARDFAAAAGLRSDELELLVSEVVTNALRYGGPGSDLRLARLADGLRVEVSDSRGHLAPRIRTPRDDEEGGRGLVLVAALARAWGSRPAADGKCVWFEIDG